MNILIFGATGMVGQSVLRECLKAPDVTRVAAVGRQSTTIAHERLLEIVAPDLTNLDAHRDQLKPYDACFFCLGVSSVGMNEADYTRVTYDLTLSVARLLLRENSQMTFVYVSGASTNANGKRMWEQVKGRTENALIALGFKAAYMFRPGIIQPMHAVRSKTTGYRVVYALATPLFGIIRKFWPRSIVTSEQVGLAMLGVARRGYAQAILEVPDIQAAALPQLVKHSS
jgi:uncharacterized protein YbjT (DUF2867 family)